MRKYGRCTITKVVQRKNVGSGGPSEVPANFQGARLGFLPETDLGEARSNMPLLKVCCQIDRSLELEVGNR
jgi:hypothetical protein